MFASGTRVRLLVDVGDYPGGTVAVVTRALGREVCEVELPSGHRLTISCLALAEVTMNGEAEVDRAAER
jgi:hypothetical protein